MYNKFTLDEALILNSKEPPQQDNKDKDKDKPDENKTKLMYYGGGRIKSTCSNEYKNQNIFGIIIIISITIFLIFKLSKSKFDINFIQFTKNHEIVKLLIGLLLLNHVRLLSTSLINTIILPLIQPIIPFLECSFNINYYNNVIEIGKFMTDLLVFILNIIILYILYIILNNALK